MNKIKLSFSWIELLAVIAIALIVARFIWAKEITEFTKATFQSFGVSGHIQYLITVPLFILIMYRYYQDGKQQVKGSGRGVIDRHVKVFAVVSLTIVVVYFFSLSRQNA